jgi:UDP-3-O-[3-hydroxymyristoyl] glucosamine N-acyltransferase
MTGQFFPRPKGLTVAEIATLTGAVPQPGASAGRRITGIGPLDRAGPGDLSFMHNAKYESQYATTHAGICIATKRFAEAAPAHVAVLVTPAPFRAFVTAAQALYPGSNRPSSLFEASGVSPGALVHPSARLESGVVIDPAAVVGPRAEIGANTVIGPNAVIGPDVRIGRDCAIGAGATVSHALIGDRVIIHAGARIGQDGFGFIPDLRGPVKVPQVYRVVIQDDVDIGANSTVDRGAIRDTVIGEGTKIDNLVQIAHNVQIGRRCLIAAQTGISGSTVVGDYVMMGGQVGVSDNIVIADGVMIAASSRVGYSLRKTARYGGTPAMPVREWFREIAALRRLARRGAGKSDGEADGGEE